MVSPEANSLIPTFSPSPANRDGNLSPRAARSLAAGRGRRTKMIGLGRLTTLALPR
jgi:hypothetical protein